MPVKVITWTRPSSSVKFFKPEHYYKHLIVNYIEKGKARFEVEEENNTMSVTIIPLNNCDLFTEFANDPVVQAFYKERNDYNETNGITVSIVEK